MDWWGWDGGGWRASRGHLSQSEPEQNRAPTRAPSRFCSGSDWLESPLEAPLGWGGGGTELRRFSISMLRVKQAPVKLGAGLVETSGCATA